MLESLHYHEHKYLSGPKFLEKLVKSSKPHASHPCMSVNDNNMEKVKETEFENPRVGIKKVGEDLNICYGSTQHTLVTVLGMKHLKENTKLKVTPVEAYKKYMKHGFLS